MQSSEWLCEKLENVPCFFRAYKYTVERCLTDLDPWSVLTSEEQLHSRTEEVSNRYPYRAMLCFAERQDTDDVGCVVTTADEKYASGAILVVHDFASIGSEVDAMFPDFWEWFRAAVEDMIEVYAHLYGD